MNPALGNFITMDPYSGSIYDPTSLHKYLYANASPVNFTDPTGYFSIPELLASFQIHGVMNTLRCVALSALRNAAIGGISGAVFGGIDAALGGRDIIEGVMQGSISGAAFGALATFAELRLILGVFGIESGVAGVFEAIENKDYDLAAWRAATTIVALISLSSELFNRTACFTEETLIYTKDGYKEIKEIQVGDEVYSENPETGEKGLKRVRNVFVNEVKELVHLKVENQEIKTTSTHPFWVEGIGWVDAGELKPGDRLVMYSGEVLEVKEAYVEYLDRPVKVYNFEVEDWHTYFVSEYNVFVHNTQGCGGSGVRSGGRSKAEQGFNTFNEAKKALGPAGEGKQWHHIVEQSQIKKSGFDPNKIHNTSNLIAIDKVTHAKISGYYNTKSFDFTRGLSVRDWLSGQSYEAQYEFGLNILKMFGVID